MIEKDTQMSSRKIPYAMYSDNWSYDAENTAELSSNSSQVTPSEYDNESMRKKIFCPRCFTPLTRAPLEGLVSTNGISAFFKHLPSYNHIRCLYRAKRGEGLNYNNEEEAREAIDNDLLVIVDRFLRDKPQQDNTTNSEAYNDTLIEDANGPNTNALISRHEGEAYNLPSKVTTVRALCRKFPENLLKGYYLPDTQVALPLADLLNKVESLISEDDKNKLYIGKITGSDHRGEKSDNNIRMTYLKFSKGGGYKDFCIKTIHSQQSQHGINDSTTGRYVIFYGKITESGIGLCVENLGYGELALLPERYNEVADAL